MASAPEPSNEVVDPRLELIGRLDVDFRDPEVLETALTHRSYAYEHDITDTNERLELLGDAVLNFVITEVIFKRLPDHAEGDLAKVRSSLVSAPTLAEVAAELGLGSAVRLGRGEELTGGREKASILADTLEAVIGAVYVDRGVRTSGRVIRRLFGTRIRRALGADVPMDPKTALQELVTRLHGVLPRYETAGEGPDHEKRFHAEVFVCGTMYGVGEGRSKKEAEQAAAQVAVARLHQEGASA